ncbi:hypothetical protein PVAP13_4NG014400 [Panicum virgatum]|uniref:DUF4220 domain-containing protein n=1 Tax=Panicum virgatum TaxID=38727 RepID=A0A8T0SW99_PANVG|nr:hypothetical protein PVAP13_4NG014400 [Panicum virgatum]
MIFHNPCPQNISSYIRDLTSSSYTNKSNDSAMVSASVIMFALTGLFFNLNLFSGVSDVSAIVHPKVRLFLSSALSLFLPVMSYLFSEAKNAGFSSSTTDLSLRAVLILAWMLLVELLRQKVDVIHMRSYSGTVQRAARVVFSVLWIICATKLVQRIAFTEAGKRSYAHGKNARLISSYMAQMLVDQHRGLSARDVEQQGGDELLKRCKYIVMGEEELVEEPTADGYKLKKVTSSDSSSIVTVGKVWEFAEEHRLFISSDKNERLKRICLSFALFKLLRRKIEHPQGVTGEEACDCRDLILRGLYSNGGTSTAETLFQVMNDEVTFLSEYYHSVVPVVLASPFFLFVNYFLLHIVVIMLCLMTLVICGNGDVSSAFHSISTDSYLFRSNVGDLVICLVSRAAFSTAAFFSIVDLSITLLLFLIFFYEEIWELFVFLLSNWFMVSLLCNHIAAAAKPQRRGAGGRAFSWALHIVMWLRSKMSHANISFKQLVPTRLVPNTLKQSIFDYLVEHDDGHGPLLITNGKSALRRNSLFDQLSWACKSDSAAEVILTWHIATSILEAKCAPHRTATATASNKEEAAAAAAALTMSRVAIRLSKYCAYLVAFHPEILPDDNQEKAELVFEDMHKELKTMLGCREYYLSSQRARIDKILETTSSWERDQETTAGGGRHQIVRNGAKLGRSLMAEASTSNDPGAAWKVVADVWTELVIYVAPSGDHDRFKGHEDLLAQGGEFISVLWALSTHVGMSRLPADKSTAGDHPKEALEE